MDRLTVGYGRISTSSGEQLSALPGQLAWLEGQGADLVLHDIERGRVVERPQYQQLRALIVAGRVGRVVATALARLGRNSTESDAFVRLCDSHGAQVITRDDGRLTMATADDLLMTRLKGSQAEGESMRLSVRVRAGLAAGRQLGKPMRRACWGYQLRADRAAFEPHPTEFRRAAQFVAHLQASGWRIAATLQSHRDLCPLNSCQSVRVWLLNPTLRGGVGYHQRPDNGFAQVTWGRHEPLLSHAQFAEFERQVEANKLLWGHNARVIPRPLTGLAECSECGYRLKYITDRTILSLRCNGSFCSQRYKGTREDVIIRYAIAAVAATAAERLAAAAGEAEPPEAGELRRSIAALEALGDPELRPVIEAKRVRLEGLPRVEPVDPGLVRRISDPRWFDTLTRDELREVLRATVERVTVTKQVPAAIRLRL